jgi:repressor LexA
MPRNANVTPRQLEILRFIRDFRRRQGYSPTMQEIGDSLGLTKVTVFEHAGALEKKRLLTRGPKHSARSLQVSDDFRFPDEASPKLPLMGRIAAGVPLGSLWLIPGVHHMPPGEIPAEFNRRVLDFLATAVQGSGRREQGSGVSD